MFKKITKIYRFLFPKSKVLLNDFNRIYPVSSKMGVDRGTPIDRYYIEKFLEGQSRYIKGRVLEVGDNFYSLKFGGSGIESNILYYNQSNQKKGGFVGDLTKENTIPVNVFDCFICTQTYNFIYEVKTAISSSYHLIKDDGVLLGSVSGIAQISRYDMDQWGDYWRFTDKSIRMLLEDAGFKRIQVFPMGNVASTTAFLQGVAVEDLPNPKILDKHDEDYQLIICFIAMK